MAIEAGQHLLHYRLIAKIGEGGMGVVWKAEDTRLRRRVALKVLPEQLAADPARRGRLHSEARAAAALSHPGIVTLHSVEEADGVCFITMELVDGRSLDRLIPDGGMAVDRLLDVAIAVSDALAAAHETGIVHRDLKPANVLVTDDGRVKVLDFGLARDTRGVDAEEATVTSASPTGVGVVMGTPAYMSPEHASGRALDARSDLFSLGVLLYEMASGRRPFEGASWAEVVSSILRDAPPPIDELRADLPGGFEEIVERCLAKQADARPASAREVCEVLRALRGRGDATPSRHAGRAARATEAPRGNLPASVDSFVAREAELGELAAFLVDTRLVTIVGVGGTGKTRLAIEAARRVAERFGDGAWIAELAPVTQAEAVPHVLADLLGAVQRPGKTMVQSVIESLRHRSLLLVLDNCEHVLDAAAELAEAITTQCAGVRILATSRENLAIRGEQVIRLQSLADEDGALLLRDRAQAAGARGEPDMETLARLSRRLDGIPLAIELAAARCGSMSPEEVERRLDDRFRLLRGSRRGRMERHQTLHNTVAWSYELLEAPERSVFDRLSAFAGSFTLEAAQAVTGGDDIDRMDVEDAVAALVARSMVLASDTRDGTRYRLLETLRQFGEARLVAGGDAARIHARHVRFFATFMTRAWAGLWSADDPRWIRAIGDEFENLRVATYNAVDGGDGRALDALLMPQTWWAWHAMRYEVGDWAEAALGVHPEPAFARSVAVHLFLHGGRADDALRLAAGLGEEAGTADPDATCDWTLAKLDEQLIVVGADVATWTERWGEAARRTGNAPLAAIVESIQAIIYVIGGDTGEARRIAVETFEKVRGSGNQTALCWTHFAMGRAHSDSDARMALEHFDLAAEIAARVGLPLQAGFAATEGAVAIARVEEPERGRERLLGAIRSFVQSGDMRQLWTSAHHLAYFLMRTGRVEEARRVWRELGGRQGWAAAHHRDELEAALGAAGVSGVSDDEFVELVRGVVEEVG